MFIKEDNTYHEILEKSVMQWLEEMNMHDDVTVRGGVKATTNYIESLKKQIEVLEDKNVMKEKYLKKIKKDVAH